jgi:hypothetical protein
MVGDENVTGFAVKSQVAVIAVGVRGLLDNETEIDRKTLKALGGAARIVGGARGLGQLGLSTNRTASKFVGDRESRDTDGKPVKIGSPARVQVTEAVMPKNP